MLPFWSQAARQTKYDHQRAHGAGHHRQRPGWTAEMRCAAFGSRHSVCEIIDFSIHFLGMTVREHFSPDFVFEFLHDRIFIRLGKNS